MNLKIEANNYLRRFDHTGKLKFRMQEVNNAWVGSDGYVTLCPKYAKKFMDSKEVLRFEDGSTFVPNGHERIAATIAHEAAHWAKDHVNQGNVLFLYQPIMLGCLSILSLSATYITCSIAILFKIIHHFQFYKVRNLALISTALFVASVAGFALNNWAEMRRSRKNEYEADTYGMELLQKAGMRPEIMLWSRKALYAPRKKFHDDRDPDTSWYNRIMYELSSTHPIPHLRYERCLAHLKKIQ